MWRVNDQVVVRRRTGLSGPVTREVRVGQISAMVDDETVLVSLPLPGGRMEKKEFNVTELEPVQKVYGRTAVQFNSIHRQVAIG